MMYKGEYHTCVVVQPCEKYHTSMLTIVTQGLYKVDIG